MRFQLLLLFFVFTSIASAQDAERIYFDENWNPSTKDDAHYYREYSRQTDSTYRVRDYFKSGAIQMDATCRNFLAPLNKVGERRLYLEDGTLESAMEFASDSVINGRYELWHPNGKPMVKGQYAHGMEVGLWKWWDEMGRATCSGTYETGKPVGVWTWYRNDGSDERVSTYDNGKVVTRTTWYSQQRLNSDATTDADGVFTVTWYDTLGVICGVERYRDGDLLDGTYTNEDGTVHSDYDRAWVQPYYRGSKDAMNEYLRESVRYPDEAGRNGIVGTVLVEVTVGVDGRLVDVVATEPAHELLTSEALRVVNTMKQWTPGRAHNRAAQVKFTLPFPFTLKRK